MITRSILILLLLTVMTHADEPNVRFIEAAQAYDSHEYDSAIELYATLIRDGFIEPELFFNAGNAYYRVGKIGLAVLHYKKALLLAPRSADIQHNLQYVQATHGAMTPNISWTARLLRKYSLDEWIAVAVASWWLSALSIVLLLQQGKRRGKSLMAILLVSMLGISLLGIYHWMRLDFRPEIVVVKPNQDALFAPLPGSTAHFALTEGSIGRVDAQRNGWYRVEVRGKKGWIEQSAVEAVRFEDKERIYGIN